MSHERGSVPAPEGDSGKPVTAPLRLFERVRTHVAAWPGRYVGMRVENGPP
jgi:hypothetical protein